MKHNILIVVMVACTLFSVAVRAEQIRQINWETLIPPHLVSVDPLAGFTQDQKDLRDALGIRHVPSLLLYRDGMLLFNQPGSFDEAALDSIVAQAESLDMDLVRAELAGPQERATN